MRVVILENAEQVSSRAADMIIRTVQAKPSCVLGLATGSTPLGTYRKLVAAAHAGNVDFSKVTSFNLDEYVGLPPKHAQSYARFMHDHLFNPAGFASLQCHLPDGNADDMSAECREYEERIAAAGGIDLQLLGLGSDGHIAFNEPGSSLASRTRIKALTEGTRADNARFFDTLDDVPRLAVTMGIGTILEARLILLMATGSNKAQAVRDFIEGPVSAQVPASALQMHPNVVVVLNRDSGGLLARIDYYQQVERLQAELDARSLD